MLTCTSSSRLCKALPNGTLFQSNKAKPNYISVCFKPVSKARVQRIIPACGAQGQSKLSPWTPGCAELGLLGSLSSVLFGGPAFAADPELNAAQQAAAIFAASGFGDAAVQAAEDLTSTPDNIVISILFTTAIAALTIVTLGVGYLSYTSWMDSRTEAEDRKKSGGLSPIASGMSAGDPARKAKKQPQEAASAKGFGKKK